MEPLKYKEESPMKLTERLDQDKEKLIRLVNDTTSGRAEVTHIGSSATRIGEKE